MGRNEKAAMQAGVDAAQAVLTPLLADAASALRDAASLAERTARDGYWSFRLARAAQARLWRDLADKLEGTKP